MARRLPRVRLRQLALDRRRSGAEPSLGAGASVLVAPDDRTGVTGSETALQACLLRVRRRAARQRGAPGAGGGARACRRSPPSRPHGPGTSATLLGTVFAHRLFDLFPVALLCTYVLLTARIPHWAVTSLIIVGLVGVALLAVAMLSARRQASLSEHHHHDGSRTVRRLLAMAREGLAVMRAPLPAAAAVFFQTVGWTLQLLAGGRSPRPST